MFGQFLERPSWGETGPEAAVNEAGELPERIVSMLAAMDIPIVRFPGGTDVSFTDWTDMISNVPGRGSDRPITIGRTGQEVTNRFGYDEFLRLAERLGWEAIIPVDFLDAAAGRKPVEEAARHAAGLLAYCNAPVGADLPRDMPDWPAIRAENGHPEPYHVDYFQIGNETWISNFRDVFDESVTPPTTENLTRRYRECLIAYIEALQAVDPDIKLIIDYKMSNKPLQEVILRDPYIRENVDFVTRHAYAPMDAGITEFTKWHHGKPPEGLTADDWKYAFSSMPGIYDEAGVNVAFGPRIELARELGYDVAVTEWNWNGWGYEKLAPPLDFQWPHAMAVGAAGFLNGMIRQADKIKIATQSMLIGHTWEIAAIHFNPDDPAKSATYNFQSAATTFYNHHHGDRVLKVETSELPRREQPYMIGTESAHGNLSTLDVVATASDDTVFIHIVNRDPQRPAVLTVDLSGVGPAGDSATWLQLVEAEDSDKTGSRTEIEEATVPLQDGLTTITAPPGSVSNLNAPRRDPSRSGN